MAAVRGAGVHRRGSRVGARAAPATAGGRRRLAVVAAALAAQAAHVAAASTRRDKRHDGATAWLPRDTEEMQAVDWAALADDGYGDGGVGYLMPYYQPSVVEAAEAMRVRSAGDLPHYQCDPRDLVFTAVASLLLPLEADAAAVVNAVVSSLAPPLRVLRPT